MGEIVILDFSMPEVNQYPDIGLHYIEEKFIGIKWLTDLIGRLTSAGFEVIGASHLKSHINSLFVCKRIHVITNRFSWMAKSLLILPKTRAYFINLESTLFEFDLYDRINNDRLPKRSVYIGFGGGARGADNAQFVTWPAEPASNLIGNRGRNIAFSMMCSNNFKSREAPFPSVRYPWRVLNHFVDKFNALRYPLYSAALDSTTSTIKLDLIVDGASRGLALYGAGWNNLDFLPSNYQASLPSCIKFCYKGRALDKGEVISKSIFSFAIENSRVKGYVTEKIIDCLRYGAIPIYFGAPDISSYVNGDCYIDGSKFDSSEALFDYISSLSENELDRMRGAGMVALEEYRSKWSSEHMVDLMMECMRSGTANRTN